MSLGWIIAAWNLNGLQGRDPGGVRCGSSNKVGGVPNGQAVQVWWQAATAPFVDSGLNMWRLRKNMYLFKSIIDKEPLTLWPFFNWQWGMTQTKKTPQQPQDQDDHSPGRQQSGWLEWPLGLAWPLDDQLVGWSNEPLGCKGYSLVKYDFWFGFMGSSSQNDYSWDLRRGVPWACQKKATKIAR